MRIIPAMGLDNELLSEFRSLFANAIAMALVREFGLTQDMASLIAAKTQSLQIARWLAKNKVAPENLDEVMSLVDAFNKLKPKLKSMGINIDVSKYQIADLKATIEKAQAAPKTMSQTRANLPEELAAIARLALGKAQRINPGLNLQKAKQLAFQWIEMSFNKIVLDHRLDGRPFKSEEKAQEARQDSIKRLVEDRREIADAVADYLAFHMDKPDIRPITDFPYHWALRAYNEHELTTEQLEAKYSIQEPSAPIPRTKIIPLPDGYRAIRVAQWSQQFADELCKSANWCVRDKRAFENSYHISDKSPVYLLLKGNHQVGLLSIDLSQFKDAQDSPIGQSEIFEKKDLPQLYTVLEALANAEGKKIKASEDFLAFLEPMIVKQQIQPDLYNDLVDNVEEMKYDNYQAHGEQPYAQTEIDNVEQTIDDLVSDYAIPYMTYAAPRLDEKKLDQLLTAVERAALRKYKANKDKTKRYPHLEKRIDQVKEVWKTIGKVAGDRVRSNPRSVEHISATMFKRYDPNGFITFLKSSIPSGNIHSDISVLRKIVDEGADEDALDVNKAARQEGFSVDQATLEQTLMEAYRAILSKPLPEPSRKFYVQNIVEPLTGSLSMVYLPTSANAVILKYRTRFSEEDMFYICNDQNLRGVIDRVHHIRWGLKQIKLDLESRASIMKIDPATATLEQAEEVYRAHAGRGRWDERIGDFNEDQPLTPAETQEQFERTSLRRLNALAMFKTDIPQDYANFTLYAFRWDQTTSTFGPEFEKIIMNMVSRSPKVPITTAPSPAEQAEPALASWVRENCIKKS